jgi:hypothetical protein
MFDAHFVESQEAVGMTIIGQFRNLDDPNKFVWLRGFVSMDERARGLAEFYGGPAWKSRRSAANETIIDNDNVLLLRPVHPNSSFVLSNEPRAAMMWFSRFPSVAAYERFQRVLGDTPLWRDSVAVELSSKVREPQTLRLSPTARSRLHG